MPGFSFGLVSRLLKNKFQFQLHQISVFEFQFPFKFHPRKLFYIEYKLFKCSIFWRFSTITMIRNSSDGRVGRAIYFRRCQLGFDAKSGLTKTQKLVFTDSLFNSQHYCEKTVLLMMVWRQLLKPKKP